MKNLKIIFVITCFLITNLSVGNVLAADKELPTIGKQKLEDKINDQEARIAELKVKLNSKLGINHRLEEKSKGNDVKLLQQFLKVEGVYPEGFVTGYFGKLTEKAVKKFQKREEIEPIGIVGPKTRAKIFKLSQEMLKIQESKKALAPAEITDVVLGSSITENGSVAAVLTKFTSTTENMYAVLSLKNAKQDSKIAYIRYYGKNYVDSGVSHPSRNGLAYFHFQWSLKPGKTRTIGDYSLVFYLDGKKFKEINYSVYQ